MRCLFFTDSLREQLSDRVGSLAWKYLGPSPYPNSPGYNARRFSKLKDSFSVIGNFDELLRRSGNVDERKANTCASLVAEVADLLKTRIYWDEIPSKNNFADWSDYRMSVDSQSESPLKRDVKWHDRHEKYQLMNEISQLTIAGGIADEVWGNGRLVQSFVERFQFMTLHADLFAPDLAYFVGLAASHPKLADAIKDSQGAAFVKANVISQTPSDSDDAVFCFIKTSDIYNRPIPEHH